VTAEWLVNKTALNFNLDEEMFLSRWSRFSLHVAFYDPNASRAVARTIEARYSHISLLQLLTHSISVGRTGFMRLAESNISVSEVVGLEVGKKRAAEIIFQTNSTDFTVFHGLAHSDLRACDPAKTVEIARIMADTLKRNLTKK
jgi:hypothetical protein